MRTFLIALTCFFLGLMLLFGFLDHQTPGTRLDSGLAVASLLAALACYFTVLLEYRSRCAVCGAPFPILYVNRLGFNISSNTCTTCGNPLVVLKPDELPTADESSRYQAPTFRARLIALASFIGAIWLFVFLAGYFGPSMERATEHLSPILLWLGSAAVIWLGGVLIQKKKPWPYLGLFLLIAGVCAFVGMLVNIRRY